MTAIAPHLGDLVGETDYPAFDPSVVDQSRPPEIQCLCPFCGQFNFGVGKPCVHCALEDTNATRAATTQREGLWFVLQARNPTAPGMEFETLQSLIRRHVVTSRSVVRGPTTGQLWRLASKVRGISREFGQCYDCGEDIEHDDAVCPHCERLQTLPETPEARGEAADLPVITVEPVTTNRIELPPEPEAVSSSEKSGLTGDIAGEPDPITIMSCDSADQTPPQAVFPDHGSDRHIPKDDLLTARDVAKAFLLEFGPTTGEKPRAASRHDWDYQKIKTGLSLVGVLMLAGLVWPVGHVIVGMFQSPAPSAAVRSTAVATSTLNAVATNLPAAESPSEAHLVAWKPRPVAKPTPSRLECTAGMLDVAIVGEGFFHVKISPDIADGTGYTRNGSLVLDENGDLVVNAHEQRELIPPINIPTGATKISITSDGYVMYTPAGQTRTEMAGRIWLSLFDHPEKLIPLQGSISTESGESGPAVHHYPGQSGAGQLMSGYIDALVVDADTKIDVRTEAATALAPAKFEPAKEPALTSSASDDPKLLLSSGMDAESRGDYAAAVTAYERIESLPSDQWPASLQMRLKLARKEMKGIH